MSCFSPWQQTKPSGVNEAVLSPKDWEVKYRKADWLGSNVKEIFRNACHVVTSCIEIPAVCAGIHFVDQDFRKELRASFWNLNNGA